MNKLPCPFCSNTDLVIVDGNKLPYIEWIQCVNCGARGPHADTRMGENPIDLWNKRLYIPPKAQ